MDPWCSYNGIGKVFFLNLWITNIFSNNIISTYICFRYKNDKILTDLINLYVCVLCELYVTRYIDNNKTT